MKPDGVNVGFNLGSAAGGSIAHLHAHVVPRWNGDNNFMPVLAQIRVLPQSLEATWERLAAAGWAPRHRSPPRPPVPAKTLHFQSPRHLSQLYAGREENLAHAERALGREARHPRGLAQDRGPRGARSRSPRSFSRS